MDKEKFLYIAQTRTQKFKKLKKALIAISFIGMISLWSLAKWLEQIDNEKTQMTVFLLFFLVVVVLIIWVSVWGILLSICPHCHEFSSHQKRANFSISVGSFELGHSSQNELNPNFCGKCGKPLSEQAVEEFFRQPK